MLYPTNQIKQSVIDLVAYARLTIKYQIVQKTKPRILLVYAVFIMLKNLLLPAR